VSVLRVSGLRAGVPGREILKGIDLEVESGQVHAVMGPNGSGKSTLSHVLMGRPGYEVLGGSVTIDGRELLGLPVWERAHAGLFVAHQYPIEVAGVSLAHLAGVAAGVSLEATLAESFRAAGRDPGEVRELVAMEAGRIGFDERFLDRPLNVDLSGGERKRNETLQLGVLRPAFAVLDELDSGLDVDALRAVSRRIEAATSEIDLGVLAITHYTRLLHELRPDVVHVLAGGRIAATGGPELAEELERTGYAAYGASDDEAESAPASAPPDADPFADPLV